MRVRGTVLGAALAWVPRRMRGLLHVATFAGVFALCVMLVVLRTAQLSV